MILSLEQALAELPDTADGIAAYFIEQECRGIRDDGCHCPVANYLRGTGEFPSPLVDPSYAYSDYSADDVESVRLPEHVAEFVERFDGGEWPELATNPRRRR